MPAAEPSLDPLSLVRRLRDESRQLVRRAGALRATSRTDAQLAAYGLEAAAKRLSDAANHIERTIDRPDRDESNDR